MIAILIGGFCIYPTMRLVLRALGGRVSLPVGHPMRELAVEVAVVGPLMLPLIGAAALSSTAWFFPAFMIAIGAHDIPFSFLYGRRQFLVLGVMMLSAGLLVGADIPAAGTGCAWFTAALLVVFGVLATHADATER